MTPITKSSSVAALIPHFQCEQWLSACLESLLEGTRPLDAIIVLDDASEHPPVDIVARHPGVTLYRAETNVGPYRLIQQAIDDLVFDAYLFQDADDWSSPLRLERLLAAAERAGAHMIGSYEVRVLVGDGDVERVRYPIDVNASLRKHPQGFPLLHPTSLVARSLLERLGGFASGMRFSGDAELLRRAGHVGRIVNAPEYLYFRRKRSGALTTSSDTGLGAPAREAVQRELRERAQRNADRVAAGREPDLAPMRVAPPVALERLVGPDPSRRSVPALQSPATRVHVFDSTPTSAEPPLREDRSAPSTPAPPSPGTVARNVSAHNDDTTESRPADHARPTPDVGKDRPPIFIVGPPRSGVALLAWCLAQSGRVHAVFDARWIGSLLREALDGVANLFEEVDDGLAMAPRAHPAARFDATSNAALADSDAVDATRKATLAEADVVDATKAALVAAGTVDATRDAALVDAGAVVRRMLRERSARTPQTVEGNLVAHVIAEPVLALDLPALDRAFPGCRIIALERPLEAVNDAFARQRSSDGEHLQSRAIEDLWTRCSRAARAATAALGPHRSMTIGFDALLADPDATMSRVMTWLDLEPDERTTRPLIGMAHGVAATATMIDGTTGDASTASASDDTPEVVMDRESWWRRYLEGTVMSEGPRAPLTARVRAAAQRIVPAGGRIAVVSRGDDALIDIDGRTAVHFPADDDGTYLGYHPADDAEALRLLDGAIARGAQWLLVPAPSLWWLEHYGALGERLASSARLALFDPDLAALFELGADGASAAARESEYSSDAETAAHDELGHTSADREHSTTRAIDNPIVTDDVKTSSAGDELARLLSTGDPLCHAIALAVSETADGATTAAERTWSERIESLRDRLNASEEPISIALPSKRKVEKLDAIGAICRLRSKRRLWGEVLMKLVRRLRPAHVVELGSCMGISTAYQAAGLAIAGSGSMVTLEGAPALAELSGRNLASLGLANVRVVQGLFVDTLPGVLEKLHRIDFAFIDGHHDEHATLRYFEQMLPKASRGAVFAFDDIRWSDGMRRAWDALCRHPAVSTSVDLGVIGICIVGSDRRHGHFAPGAPEPREAPARSLAALIEPPLAADARVLVVSRGDDRRLELGAARGIHFPHDDSGAWIGYHPADSVEACRMLAAAIDAGATHLLIPEGSHWWLEFYDAFARALDERHSLVARTEHYVLYRLTPQEKPSAHSLREAIDQEQE